MPESSIIIPVFQQWKLARNSLKSIAAHTPPKKYEVIIVADACAAKTGGECFSLGKQLFAENFHYIEGEKDHKLAEAANLGAKAAKGKFLIFMDNGMEVTSGWYEPLMNDFCEFPDVAAASPLVVKSEETSLGKIALNLGLVVSPLQKLEPLYPSIPAQSPLAKKRRFFRVLPAACLAIRKSLFTQMGGFGESLSCNLAGIDLCLRLSSQGFRLTVNPASMVVQPEETEKKDGAENGEELLPKNFAGKLKADWQEHLQKDGLELEISPWLAPCVAPPKTVNEKYDPLASDMSSEDLAKTLVDIPHWKRGWLELVARQNDLREQAKFGKIFLELFPDPASLFSLAAVAHELGLSKSCMEKLKEFAIPPEDYGRRMRALHASLEEQGLRPLASQVGGYIKNNDNFLRKDYPAFAKELLELQARLGIIHLPQSPMAYFLWRRGVDMPARERELASFYEACQKEPGSFPKISILMPVYNPDPAHLRAALDSVLAQTYSGWELCIADDASSDARIADILADYSQRDDRVKFMIREKNGHIAAASNSALELATCPWCAFMDQDDALAPDALAFVAKAIKENPGGSLFFSDEDKIYKGKLASPYFKNGKWDWELLPVQNFVCHLAVYNSGKLRGLGGIREGYPGAQDHDLVLRYTANEPASSFVHIPHVLYHWRMHSQSTAATLEAKPYALESARKAAQEWLDSQQPGSRLEALEYADAFRIKYPTPDPRPAVSVICHVPQPFFPVAEYAAIMRAGGAFETIFVCKKKDGHEIIRNLPPNARKKCVILPIPDDWPISKGLQMAAQAAKGEILGFLDGNVLPNQNGPWLDELVSCLCREDVGVVGGRMESPQGNLAHGGYMADASGGLKPILAGYNHTYPKWYGWTDLARTVDALDRLCLFTPKSLFTQNGGFDPSLDEWSAQDYCLRLGKQGLRTVWQPFAEFKMLNDVHAAKGVENFIHKWKLEPANKNILSLGAFWQLQNPDDPSHDFSIDEYVRLYPDVANVGADPLEHYLGGGIWEGRKGRLSIVDYQEITPQRVEQWKKSPKNGIVVCTSLCGDYEDLLPPVHLNDGWQYVCYSDKPRESWGVWDIRPIPYENSDLTRRSRWAKMNLPLLFPDAERILWLDANIIIKDDPSQLLSLPGNGFWMVRHPSRRCIYQEAEACIAAEKDKPDALKAQAAAYAKAGMPKNFGLWENNCFVIDPSAKKIKNIFQAWWHEYCSRSKRDQISLPYVFYKSRFTPFPLLPGGKSARNWPAFHFLTHDESAWIKVPPHVPRQLAKV